MPYIFGKLWHLAIIWVIRKAFQCILQGVRILLAKYTRISPTSENDSYLEHRTCRGNVNDENDADDKKCFGRCHGSPLRGTVNSSVRPPALQRSRHHQSCFHHYHHSEDYFDHRHYHCSQCCMLEEGLVWIPFHSGRPNDLLFPPPSRPNCT